MTLVYFTSMDMTPNQLRFLREQRNMTRDDLANYLGDCTASTINKWERSINPVPAWVADKMFSKMPVEFTLEELAEMYELCREEACSMSELIQDGVRELLRVRRLSQTSGATKFPQQIPLDKVAEPPAEYKAPKKTGTDG